MGSYTIKDLEKLSGIKAHTIRIWEKRYKLIEPQRTSTNIRTYCDAELKKLLNISVLNRNGFKISKIATLSQEEVTENIARLSQNSDDVNSTVENLTSAMIDMDENTFEKILARSVIALGFEDTMIKVLYPFFVKIGVMWQTGSINPAQEHFVSNLVRQKLLVAIDNQITGDKPGSKTFVLFLPEDELHELGLLFYNYIVRKRGHKVIYLGQSVPLSDLVEVCKIRSCDYLVTSFTASKTSSELTEYLNTLAKEFSGKTIYASGKHITDLEENIPDNIITFVSPLELSHKLEQLK